MTACAFRFCSRMRPMTEENEFRQLIDALRWNLTVLQRRMARAALCDRRKAGAGALLGVLVAGDALQLQRSMLFVIKRRRLFCRCQQTYGKENATNESEYLSLYLLPPPAATTTYCFFVFFE